MLITPEVVHLCMREAGWAVLRFHPPGYSTSLKLSRFAEMVPDQSWEAYVSNAATRPLPTLDDIWIMDRSQEWLQHITDDRDRLVVCRRMLYDAGRDRHIYSWKRIAEEFSMSTFGAQRAYDRGIAQISVKLANNFRLWGRIRLYVRDLEPA